MQRLSRIGRNTFAVSVSTLLLSACNQGDDAPKPAAVAPQPAAPSMAALSIPLCLNGQCAVIDQDAKLLVPFDNDYDNIVASAYQGTLMAAREERWNLIQAKDGKVLRDDIGEALSLLTPNLYGFVRDGKYGVVDGQGKEVQAPRFDDIYPNSANEFIIYEIDGKRGILDAKGKQLTEALYDTTLVNGSVAEHGGLISAERGEEKWIINLATGEQKAVAYESLGDLHDGVMSASVIGKGSQLVDAKGDVVGDGNSYDYLGTPANGLVAFREKYDSPCGYLDYQGKVAIAAQFAGCGAFGKQGGLAQQRMEDGSSGKYGLIDRSGAWKVQPQYDSADSAGLTALGYTVDVPGLAAVGVSTGLFSADFGIFNLDEGSEWVKPGYAQIGALGNDLFVVAKKGGPQKTVSFMGSESQVPVVGLMDRSGKMLLEPGELISIQSAYDGRFLEALDGMDNAAHTVARSPGSPAGSGALADAGGESAAGLHPGLRSQRHWRRGDGNLARTVRPERQAALHRGHHRLRRRTVARRQWQGDLAAGSDPVLPVGRGAGRRRRAGAGARRRERRNQRELSSLRASAPCGGRAVPLFRRGWWPRPSLTGDARSPNTPRTGSARRRSAACASPCARFCRSPFRRR